MRVSRVLLLAATLAGAGAAEGKAGAFPAPVPLSRPDAVAAEPVQAFCGPRRCFARPFWRYRSGAGFLPSRRFAIAPPPPRFAPFGFRRFGGFGGRPSGFRRF